MPNSIATLKSKYLTECGDTHAQTHYLVFRANDLSLQVVVNWLLVRLKQDKSPLKNLDNTIAVEPEDFTWDAFLLFR
jgi:hypothetical protein